MFDAAFYNIIAGSEGRPEFYRLDVTAISGNSAADLHDKAMTIFGELVSANAIRSPAVLVWECPGTPSVIAAEIVNPVRGRELAWLWRS